MQYQFYTADVFTGRIFGGNPLAVFPEAQSLEKEQMQLVAREFNLSETVFVLPPEDARHTRRLRIFTPAAELPFAGHPTVGAAFVLATIGEIDLAGEVTQIVFEEGVGPVEVAIRTENGEPVFTQLSVAKLPDYGPPLPPIAEIARALSLESSDLMDGAFAPQAVSCGVPFLLVPVRSLDTIRRIRLNSEQWGRVLASYWAPQLYVFTRETESEDNDLHARMFAPTMGISEDPATGAAVSALGGYLGTRDVTRDGTVRWIIEQGIEMGRPSILELEVDKVEGEITAVRVGGASVLVSEGQMEIPDLAR
ncbi:MAG: PhzF family phenazine biosynthesis protein [Chloroflexota bacterium]|nr:PhzF family phenazine biosynthesis protein [Chloroflexota bacterium]